MSAARCSLASRRILPRVARNAALATLLIRGPRAGDSRHEAPKHARDHRINATSSTLACGFVVLALVFLGGCASNAGPAPWSTDVRLRSVDGGAASGTAHISEQMGGIEFAFDISGLQSLSNGALATYWASLVVGGCGADAGARTRLLPIFGSASGMSGGRMQLSNAHPADVVGHAVVVVNASGQPVMCGEIVAATARD